VKNLLNIPSQGNLYLEKVIDTCEYHYKQLLTQGVCPEQARMVLPQCLYTSYYVTGSLAAWARAYQLRIDKHAQHEIQILAEEWNKIIEPLFPVSWEALKTKS
jgi:thymidylate synthase (FAD)